ncbi:unnamed protein product [Mesocestoides corti]|uniref:DUF7041 domain-containing protein n=2 Tax=Mesocestoides corti TaxID=53468 RepID=A0A0R3UB58_MESCO|nr:unnamed protein product [Mesocestoides corti]
MWDGPVTVVEIKVASPGNAVDVAWYQPFELAQCFLEGLLVTMVQMDFARGISIKQPDTVSGWFAILESQLHGANIISRYAKYSRLVTALTSELADEVSAVLIHPDKHDGNLKKMGFVGSCAKKFGIDLTGVRVREGFGINKVCQGTGDKQGSGDIWEDMPGLGLGLVPPPQSDAEDMIGSGSGKAQHPLSNSKELHRECCSDDP